MPVYRGVGRVVGFDMLTTAGAADTTNAPTVQVSKDGGAFAATTNAAARIGATNAFALTLTASEMTADLVVVQATATGDVPRTLMLFTEADYTSARSVKIDNLDATVGSRSTYAGADTSGTTTLLSRVPNTLPSFPSNFASFSIDASGRALLQPTQAFNNTGQTTAPAWLGVTSVLLTSDHTAISGADVPAGLTAQGYTATRAGYLDTLYGLVAAIWANVSRSLTTFGTLTTDAAAAVWAAGTRTLSAFGFAVAASNLPSDYARNNATPGWYTAPDNADVAAALSDLVSLLARTDPTTALTTLQTAATAIEAKTDLLTFTGSSVNAAINGDATTTLYGTAGAIAYTYTVFDVGGTAPLPGAAVYVSADSAGTRRSQTQVTDSLGRVTFQLDAGTVFFWASHPDRTFSNPVSEIIGP